MSQNDVAPADRGGDQKGPAAPRGHHSDTLRTVARALRFLAHRPRPGGGEDLYNAEHLLQLARELEALHREAVEIAAQLAGTPKEGRLAVVDDVARASLYLCGQGHRDDASISAVRVVDLLVGYARAEVFCARAGKADTDCPVCNVPYSDPHCTCRVVRR